MTTPWNRSRLPVSLVVLALLGVMFIVPSAHAAARADRRTTTNEITRRMLRLVNRSRADHGLGGLRINEDLCKEALRHSRHMAKTGSITHTSNLADLVRSVGGTVFGEDLAKGRGLEGIRSAWMRLADTRRILLDPRFQHVGLGVVHIDGFFWVTLQAFD